MSLNFGVEQTEFILSLFPCIRLVMDKKQLLSLKFAPFIFLLKNVYSSQPNKLKFTNYLGVNAI